MDNQITTMQEVTPTTQKAYDTHARILANGQVMARALVDVCHDLKTMRRAYTRSWAMTHSRSTPSKPAALSSGKPIPTYQHTKSWVRSIWPTTPTWGSPSWS